MHSETPRLAQIPGLDGFRGVGILGGIAYHEGIPGSGGMFLLIDGFFVLSGFLITSLLLVDWRRHGTLSFSSFWTRRARRLLPALLIVVCAVVVGEAIWGDPAGFPSMRGNALATLFYSANWYFIATHSNYFGQISQASPLQHTWTLSVEEQFYIVWPLLLYALLRWGRSPGVVAVVGTLGAIASSIAMGWFFNGGAGLNHAYYGTDCRAQALLSGAVLAAVMTRWRVGRTSHGPARWGVAGSAATAGLVVMFALAAGPASWMFHGGFLAGEVLTAVVLGSLVFAPNAPVTRFLSLRPVRWLGRISYGLYLWQLPVIQLLTPSGTHLAIVPLDILRTSVSICLAALSYHLIENPIRQGTWLKQWKAWAATPVAVAVAGAGALVLGAAAPVANAADLPSTTTPYVPPSLRAHPLQVLVVGDSNAVELGIGLQEVGRVYGVDIIDDGILGCGVLTTGVVFDRIVERPDAGGDRECESWPTTWAHDVEQVHPDVVLVVLGGWEVLDHDWGSGWEWVGQADFDRRLVTALREGISVLSTEGAPVLLCTTPYFSPAVGSNGRPSSRGDDSRVDAFNVLLREVATRSAGRASVVEVGAEVSSGGRYAEYIGGVEVRSIDGIHYTTLGGEWLAPWIMPQIVSAGVRHRAVSRATSAGVARATTGAGRSGT